MRALLRKDAPWLLGFAAAGLLVQQVVLFDSFHGAELWFEPQDRFGPATLSFLWAAATLLGVCAGLFEEVTGTRDYLLHRPVSPARLFWTRHLGGALVVTIWILLGPSLHWLFARLTSDDAALADGHRWWRFVADGTPGLVFYAVGVFSAALARRPVLAVPLAALAGLGVLAVFAFGQFAEPAWPLFSAGVVPLSLAFGAALLFTARQCEREGRDLDRPPARARLVAAVVALGLTAIGPAVALYLVQASALRDLFRNYPVISQRRDGTAILLGRRGNTVFWRVDEFHEPTGTKATRVQVLWDPYAVMFRPESASEDDRGPATHFGGVRYWRIPCPGPMRCYFGSDGLVGLTVSGRPGTPGPAGTRTLGKAGGGRFSPRTRVIGRAFDRRALLGDPEDGGVWIYDLEGEAPAFVRVPLPNDDRFVDDLSFGRAGLLIKGARTDYQLDEDGFARALPPAQRSATDQTHARPAPPQVQQLGAYGLSVSLPGNEGTFTHVFAPYTSAEKTLVLYSRVPALARAPLLELLSVAGTSAPPATHAEQMQPSVLLDPIVARGARVPLVLDLSLAGLLVGLAWWRLARLQVPVRRRIFWIGQVALFGPAGYVACHMLESRRARRTLPLDPARPLLIKSAA
jgi:hypothetical protein